MAAHTCHAIGCGVEVAPEMLMCKVHWARVPKLYQRRVWAYYRDGQCDDKSPSTEWCRAADDAVVAVAAKDGLAEKAAAWRARGFLSAFHPDARLDHDFPDPTSIECRSGVRSCRRCRTPFDTWCVLGTPDPCPGR